MHSNTKLAWLNVQIHLRSAQTNSAFRKLFSLPPEEFLIDDFTCHLKRKMPLQVIMLWLHGTAEFLLRIGDTVLEYVIIIYFHHAICSAGSCICEINQCKHCTWSLYTMFPSEIGSSLYTFWWFVWHTVTATCYLIFILCTCFWSD